MFQLVEGQEADSGKWWEAEEQNVGQERDDIFLLFYSFEKKKQLLWRHIVPA